MQKEKWLLLVAFFLGACKNQSADIEMLEKEVDEVIKSEQSDPDRMLKLTLNPINGSEHIYKSENETSYRLEHNQEETNSIVSSNVQYHYIVFKDSTPGFSMKVLFDSIKITTKKNDQLTDADAARSNLSANPIDKMLGVLLEQPLSVKVTSSGVVKSIHGYEELGQKFLAKFAQDDAYGKTLAKEQYDKLVANGLVKGQLNQVFRALPDTAVYEGFTWKVNEKLGGEIPLDMFTILKIKSIDPEGQIVIVSSAALKSEEQVVLEMPGQKGVTAKLSGYRKGIIRLNAKTGIVERTEYRSDISGTVLALGNLIPIRIENKTRLEKINK